ncbi:MAG: hypothetical protein Q7U57_19490 [Methylovulum sp.]|nr:hypothetical protein [Methylovulum sp.]
MACWLATSSAGRSVIKPAKTQGLLRLELPVAVGFAVDLLLGVKQVFFDGLFHCLENVECEMLMGERRLIWQINYLLLMKLFAMLKKRLFCAEVLFQHVLVCSLFALA